MTLTLAALVLTNLLYLVGAVAVASLVSGLYVLRHRKPKSLESGIESFSRELRALAPEHGNESNRTEPVAASEGPRPPVLRARSTARGPVPRRSSGGSVATATGRRTGAGARPGMPVSRDPDAQATEGLAPAEEPTPPGPVADRDEPQTMGGSTESGEPTEGAESSEDRGGADGGRDG